MSEQVTLTNIPILLLSQGGDALVKCLMAAHLPVDLSEVNDGYSYWLSDIILMPIRKFTAKMKDDAMYSGWKFSDVLQDPSWPNPKHWDEKEIR